MSTQRVLPFRLVRCAALLVLSILPSPACKRTPPDADPRRSAVEDAPAAGRSALGATGDARATPDEGAAGADDRLDDAGEVGTLVDSLLAGGDGASAPSLESVLWCDLNENRSKILSTVAVVSNLPAISQDGAAIALVEVDSADGPSSTGASLVIVSTGGAVQRRVRLWSVTEAEEQASMSAAACRALRPTLEARFAEADVLLDGRRWRAMTGLPKSHRLVERMSDEVRLALPDGGSELAYGALSVLESLTVLDARGTKVIDLDPGAWIATHQPKGLCAAAAPNSGLWYDEPTRSVLIVLRTACHNHSISDTIAYFTGRI